ncbi:hypothetical protein [Streptomyces sp. NBC_00140]|uniref:hypothetical protein n=1 Tax=Streptomyces sp. NBC_00140 TaxID=2975664 RepID=UPI00224D269B|nr:hypothetical protein [Streptomyces sp. NBC_00140]MCX5333933.1 hypothetical protein [Streptomyces sp. NBC_00140]
MSVYAYASLRRTTPCPECRSPADWVGVQALVGDSLRWDVEVACPACRFAVADCGGELSDDVREQLLAEHGAAVLCLRAPAHRVTVLRVLRAALGLELAAVKDVLEQVWGGAYVGTPPEVELLARRLRAAGVDAVASAGP